MPVDAIRLVQFRSEKSMSLSRDLDLSERLLASGREPHCVFATDGFFGVGDCLRPVLVIHRLECVGLERELAGRDSVGRCELGMLFYRKPSCTGCDQGRDHSGEVEREVSSERKDGDNHGGYFSDEESPSPERGTSGILLGVV